MKKSEAIQELRRVHDALKEHPYRYNFSKEYEKSYAKLLYDLSGAWGKLIHWSDVADDEKKLLQKYGAWIHNYNASLFGYRVYRNLIPYYESVLSATHRYIETGDLSSFYELDYRWRNGVRYMEPTRYYLVTKESCGIDSPELPRYFPHGERLSDDEKTIREYFEKYTYSGNQEEIEKRFQHWKANLLPVIQWHNKSVPEEYVPKHDGMPVWRSV